MVDYRLLDSLLIVENPKIIFEFGTFDGTDTLHYTDLLPQAEIWTFDADKRITENFKKKIDDKRIHAYNYAITDHCGTVGFYKSDFIDGNPGCSGSIKQHTSFHINHQKDRQIFGTIPIEVPAITIEDFCHANKIKKIDFMHVDTEGNIEEVINGWGSFIPRILRIEIYELGPLYKGIKDSLYYDTMIKSMGYKYMFMIEYDAVYKLK